MAKIKNLNFLNACGSSLKRLANFKLMLFQFLTKWAIKHIELYSVWPEQRFMRFMNGFT